MIIKRETIDSLMAEFMKVDETFIICDKKFKIKLITCSNNDVVDFLLKGEIYEKLSDWKAGELFSLLQGLSSPTCKYRTVSNHLYVKYNYYTELYGDYVKRKKNISSRVFGNLLRLRLDNKIILLERKYKIEKLIKKHG